MASHPDAHPDSDAEGASDSPEQVSPETDPGREGVEDSLGDFAGTAGTAARRGRIKASSVKMAVSKARAGMFGQMLNDGLALAV